MQSNNAADAIEDVVTAKMDDEGKEQDVISKVIWKSCKNDLFWVA